MDRATAQRLEREFDVARAEFHEQAEAARWDFVEAVHGFTGPAEKPTGLLVSMGETKKAGRRFWLVPFSKSDAGYAFAARESWQEVIPSIVTKAEATAASIRAATPKPATTEAAVDLFAVTTDPDEQKVQRAAARQEQLNERIRRAKAREHPPIPGILPQFETVRAGADPNSPDNPFKVTPQPPPEPDSEQTIEKIAARRRKRESGN